MAHKFFKKSYVNNDLPSNLDPSSWNRLNKRAHAVWDMAYQNDKVEAFRKMQDTARVSDEVSDDTEDDESLEETPLDSDLPLRMISPGDMILLFLGGKRIEACVLGFDGNNNVDLASSEGTITGIPLGWVRKI